MSADVRIGTSGYSFHDWVGTVYPDGTRASDMLAIYARDFDVVEINFTYYRDPTPEIFERMLRKVDSGFEFVVKAPAGLTHERTDVMAIVRSFVAALRPLLDAGQLGGVLAQFPQSFHHNVVDLEYLKTLADALPLDEVPVHVEFRHEGWANEAAYAALRSMGFGYVNVDLPPLPALPRPSNVLTNDVGYVRLHGRNTGQWHNPNAGGRRYDYIYAEEELDEWAMRVDAMLPQARKIYVFTNNCHKGSSFVNALRIKQSFDQPVRSEVEADGTLFASPDPSDRIRALTRRVSDARAAEADG
jgi:uncharacterized protein YecE (DUF72 family)